MVDLRCGYSKMWTPTLYLLGVGFVGIVTTALAQTPANLYRTSCDNRQVEVVKNADAVIGGLFSIHSDVSTNGYGCGPPISDSIQGFEAVRWILDLLNKKNITISGELQVESYIPGVKLGMKVIDTCMRKEKALGGATELFPRLGGSEQTCTQTNNAMLGLIDMNPSPVAMEMAELGEQYNLPVVSFAATSSSLSNKLKYPNFMRTIQPERKGLARAVTEVLKHLGWSHITAVYTDDPKSMEYYQEFLQTVAGWGICVGAGFRLSHDDTSLGTMNRTLNQLIQAKATGVLYFGTPEVADSILRAGNGYTNAGRLQWIFADSISISSLFPGLTYPRGIIAVQPFSRSMAEFEDHWVRLDEQSPPAEDPWFAEWYMHEYQCNLPNFSNMGYPKSCSSISESNKRARFVQGRLVEPAALAVYTYARALRTAHNVLCFGVPGMCPNLRSLTTQKFYEDYLKKVDFTFMTPERVPSLATPNSQPYFAPETLKFDGNLDILNSAYKIFNFNNNNGVFKFSRVATVKGTNAKIVFDGLQMFDESRTNPLSTLPESSCPNPAGCEMCKGPEYQAKYMFLNGDVILNGIFSIHRSGSTPLSCGELSTYSPFIVEAMKWAVENQPSGILNGVKLGMLAFDDCMSPLISKNLAYGASSGMMRIEDGSGRLMQPNTIEGYVAAHSSDLSIAFSDFINRVHKPMISYAATSPVLSNQIEFPYFLRTIPSDTSQIRAIVMMLKLLGWKNIQAVQEASAYGRDGIRELKRIGAQEGICVVAVHEADTNTDMADIIERLRARPWAQPVVLYLQTVSIKNFLRAFNNSGAKGEFVLIGPETWGKNIDVLAGLGDVAEGSITVQPAELEFGGFMTHLSTLDVRTYLTNPWFAEIYEMIHNCSIDSRNPMYPMPCGNQPITDININLDLYSRYTIAAVNTFAIGLDSTLAYFCGAGYRGVCSQFTSAENKIDILMQNIERAQFSDDNLRRFAYYNRAGNLDFMVYSVTGLSQSYSQIATYKPLTNLLTLEGPISVDDIKLPDPNKRLIDWQADCPGLCTECMYMFAHQTYMHKPGDVVLPTVFDIHNSGQYPFDCGDHLSDNGFLATEAFAFALDKVNDGSAPVRLNGVQLGGLAFDGCSSATRTKQLVTSFVGFNGLGMEKLTADRHPGWMTFNSDGTREVVDILQTLGIPLVSPGATSPLLNNRLKPPGTFYRTVPSDSKIAMALLQIAKEMGFNYTVSINAQNSASRAIKNEFKRMAKDYGICIAASYEFVADGSMDTILKAVVEHETDIVFVFTDSTTDLENIIDAKGKNQTAYGKIVFLTNKDLEQIINSADTQRKTMAEKSISVDVENMDIVDLDSRLDRQYRDPESVTGNPWFREHFQSRFQCSFPGDWKYTKKCDSQTASVQGQWTFNKGRWAFATVDAVFSYAQAIHRTLEEKCGANYTGVCQAFTTSPDVQARILANLEPVTYAYPLNQQFRFIGRESNRAIRAVRVAESLSTNTLGYLQPDGSISAFLATALRTKSSLYNGIRDQCVGQCSQCEIPSETSDLFIYLNADIFIGGLFDVHKAGPTPFTCGNINKKHGFALLEAFNFAIDYVNKKKGIFTNILRGIRFGGASFDVCQQPDRAGNIVANIHSGNRPLVVNNQIVDPDRFDVYIGPFDTESSIRVADVLDVMGIPQVSYGATSLELRDARDYRYFLRSVPADDKQARALISYLKFARINYVQVIYTFNSVGERGRQEFVRLAYLNKICVAQNITIGMNGPVDRSEADEAVAKLQRRPQASTVILFVDEPQVILQAIESNTNIGGKYLIVGTDKWGADPDMLIGLNRTLTKAVTFDIETADIPEFDHYLHGRNPSTYNAYPWFDEYYEAAFGCQILGSGSQRCEGIRGLSRSPGYLQDPYALYVVNAVFATAVGVHHALLKHCGQGYSNACDDFRISGERRQMILNGMRQVNFTDWTGQPFYFTPGGESDRGYHLYQVQFENILKTYVYEDVGSYNDTHFLKIDAAYSIDHHSSCNIDVPGDCKECQFPVYQPSRYMLKRSSEDLNVVSVLNIHKAGATPLECGEIDLDSGFQNLLAFFYAIDMVNKNADGVLTSTLKLGGLALDTCSSPIQLGQDLYSLLSGEGLCSVNERTGQIIAPSSVVAYIPDGSTNSIITSSIMSPRKITSISQSATSVELSNKDVHSYFLRTVPPDDKQAVVMIDILHRMGFNFASVVYSYNDYGKSSAELLLQNAEDRNGTTCIGKAIALYPNATAQDAQNVITELRSQVGGRAVILFLDQEHTRLLLEAARDMGVRNRFVWIGSDTWADSPSVVEGLEDFAQGAVTIQIRSEVVDGFKTYMSDLSLNNRKGIPDDWFEEFYQRIHQCRILNSEVSLPFPQICDGTEKIKSEDIVQNPYVLHTIIGTYMVAQGLNGIDECSQTNLNIAGCLELQDRKRELIYNGISGAEWNVLPNDLGNNSFLFRLTPNGYGDIEYKILNYHRNRNTGQFEYKKIGSWQDGLTLDPEEYIGSSSSSQLPLSRCPIGNQCKCQANNGRTYNFRSVASTSLYTINAGQDYVDPVSGMSVSVRSQPQLADRFVQAWGTIVATCAAIGLFLSMCLFVYLLIVYPVRDGTSILGYLLVFGLIIMFAMVFPFILHANDVVCGLRRFGLGVAYSICFAALFVKLVDAWRTRHKEEFSEVKYEKLGRPMGLLFIAICLIGIQILISAEWLILQHPTSEYAIYNGILWPRCSPDQDMGMMKNYDTGLVLSLIYVMFLIFLCIVFGFCTWSARKNHREARYILGVSLFSVLVWIPWCLASTLSEYKVRDPAVAIGLLVNAFIILFFIPLRKLYLFNRYQKDMREEENNSHYLISSGKTEDYSVAYPYDQQQMVFHDNSSLHNGRSHISRSEVLH